MKKILVFTGAGFTAPLGLPTTTQFIDRIRKSEGEVTRQIVAYLGHAGNDIEAILSTLETFKQQVSVTEFLLNRIGAHPNFVGDALGRISNLKAQVPSEITRIQKLIFDTLQNFETSKATQLYLNVYKQIKKHYSEASVSFVTTNYDLTLESAFENAANEWDKVGIKNVDFGFVIEYGRPIYDPKAAVEWKPEVIDFLKIHGSLDWHKDQNGKCSRAGVATTPNDPSQIPILYPGFKSVPENEPFFSLHSKFYKRLTEADIIFVIGFAFRDSYINTLFENIMRSNPKTPIYCLNPIKVDEAPNDSRLPYFASRYSSFRHINMRVEVSEKPLGDFLIDPASIGLADLSDENQPSSTP